MLTIQVKISKAKKVKELQGDVTFYRMAANYWKAEYCKLAKKYKELDAYVEGKG